MTLPPIIFRIDTLIHLCKNKSVLHLGYVQHSDLYKQLSKEGKWLHQELAKTSKKIVGIDYLKDEVSDIKEKYGYEGYYGDAQKLEDIGLNETFDIILCGELIEHVTNPGLMLEGVKQFMSDNSLLIITTPNVWGKRYMTLTSKNILEQEWVNEEHTCWYSHFTLSNTLKRHGFKEVHYDFYFGFNASKDYYDTTNSLIGKLKNIKRKWVAKTTPKRHQEGLFFVAKK